MESFCLIRCLTLKVWAIGIGGGTTGREKAAKLALCLAVAQSHPSLAAHAHAYPGFPEFGSLFGRFTNLGFPSGWNANTAATEWDGAPATVSGTIATVPGTVATWSSGWAGAGDWGG